MLRLIFIALLFTASASIHGQIFLTPEGNATSALGLARKQLMRMAYANMDVFVPSNSEARMGWVLAQEDGNGKTQIDFLCTDTALEKQVSIHPNHWKEINWKNITHYPVSKSIIVQPFIFSGSESRKLNEEDTAAAEARLKAWLDTHPGSRPMFLEPLVETIHVISCCLSCFPADKIPKSALPKLSAPKAAATRQ